MNKVINITQFILAIVILLSVTAWTIAHIVMGNITSLIGYVVTFVIILLAWRLVRITWKELKEEELKENKLQD